MNDVRKSSQPQQPAPAQATPQWRHLRQQARPCTERMVAVKCVQLVRQKWLVAGKTRWCDYA